MSSVAEISVVIATRNRKDVLLKSLQTLNDQTLLPAEIIIVDGSAEIGISNDNSLTNIKDLIKWVSADALGAARQRNQGVKSAESPFILFMDDDAYLEKDVVEKLWKGINLSSSIGAVNAMITNQNYSTPGFATRWMYRLMSEATTDTYAGKVIGPAWNLLPEDDSSLPEYVQCEWLNTTCTLYRRSAMPDPVFSDFFKGYSLMEDVTLSTLIGRNFKLLNARTARIFHDSQPGDHKDNVAEIAQMALVNRYHVMTHVLGRTGFSYKYKLVLLEFFWMVTNLRSIRRWSELPNVLLGKIRGMVEINRTDT